MGDGSEQPLFSSPAHLGQRNRRQQSPSSHHICAQAPKRLPSPDPRFSFFYFYFAKSCLFFKSKIDWDYPDRVHLTICMIELAKDNSGQASCVCVLRPLLHSVFLSHRGRDVRTSLDVTCISSVLKIHCILQFKFYTQI